MARTINAKILLYLRVGPQLALLSVVHASEHDSERTGHPEPETHGHPPPARTAVADAAVRRPFGCGYRWRARQGPTRSPAGETSP